MFFGHCIYSLHHKYIKDNKYIKDIRFFPIVCKMCFSIIKCNNGNYFANCNDNGNFQI